MAYRLRREETLEDGVRRIASEQFDRADAEHSSGEAHWVHQSRKCLKRTRALLRLVRAGMPKADYEARNALLREIGQAMSARRDSDVRRQTHASLMADAPKSLAAALAKLDLGDRPADAKARRKAAKSTEPAVTFEVAAVQKSLGDARKLLAGTRVRGDVDVVEEGLIRAHRRGRNVLEAARREGEDESFHDLRKAVQAHWRQMQLLSEAWPAMLKARISEARDVAEALGREHDLSVFSDWARTSGAQTLTATDVRAIAARCKARKAALRAEALAGADRLFMQKPSSFAADIVRYWQLAPEGVAKAAADVDD